VTDYADNRGPRRGPTTLEEALSPEHRDQPLGGVLRVQRLVHDIIEADRASNAVDGPRDHNGDPVPYEEPDVEKMRRVVVQAMTNISERVAEPSNAMGVPLTLTERRGRSNRLKAIAASRALALQDHDPCDDNDGEDGGES
jgi:hypothetical protein